MFFAYYMGICGNLTSLRSLLIGSEAGEAPYITSAGFQFLLLDTASQLWYLTLQYLNTAQVLFSTSSELQQLSKMEKHWNYIDN